MYNKGGMMSEDKSIDYDDLKINIEQGLSICCLMTGFSDDDDLGSKAVRALGLQLQEKFRQISLNLGL